jgi:hypothetical protein
MRPRFSLRTLLLLTTIASIACYWWFIRPSRIALQFVCAVQSSDFQAADAWFRNASDRCLRELSEKSWRFKASAELLPWTLRDILVGTRNVNFQLMYGDAGPLRDKRGILTISPNGISTPEFWGGSSYGFSI